MMHPFFLRKDLNSSPYFLSVDQETDFLVQDFSQLYKEVIFTKQRFQKVFIAHAIGQHNILWQHLHMKPLIEEKSFGKSNLFINDDL